MLEGFTKLPLSKVASIERGKFSARPRNDPRYYGGEIPFLQTGDIARAGRIVRNWTQTLNELGLGVSKMFPRGTIFMSIAANIGDVAISDFDAACPDSVVAVKPRDGFDSEWVFQSLKFSRKGLAALSTQNAQANLSLEKIEPFKVHVPPLHEQRRIAEILRTWDEAIEKLEALRAARERRRLAAARQFFDPCHPKHAARPNDWQEHELGDVFRERVDAGSADDRLLSITMNGGVIDRDDVGRKDTSTADKSKYKLILPGDLGYNTMRMWQGVVGLSSLQGIVSPAYTIVTPVSEYILGAYAAHLFKSRRMVFDFERYSQGLTSDTWNLKFPAFSRIRVFLPPVELQKKKADLLDGMLAEAAIIDREITALQRQKRGLMQKLLTGEWRVSVDPSQSQTDEKEAAHG
ncbi:MAG: restriction endonuclease subunit S [Pseudomonadota bacterium]